jgi:amino acid transporter
MMNKINSLSLYVSYAAISFLPATASAQLFGPTPPIGGVEPDDTGEGIRTGVLNILVRVLSFMALAAVVVVVIAGIRLIVSQGEEQEKDKAKKTILYAIIGLVVILLARAIISFVAGVTTP